MIPIVIPLHHRGGKHGDDTELRFALRSIAMHFKEPHEIVIVGRKLPGWLTGARHLAQTTGGLKTALKLAAEAYPDGFFWMYDDCCLLRDTTAAEMKVTCACKGWRTPRTGWARSLDRIRQRLLAEGLPARDYSRPHGPYWFDQGMIDEAFADWPKMAGKFPFESWILSKRDWPCRHGVVRQYYGPFTSEPGPNSWFLNYNGKGLSDGMMEYLRRRFPEPGRHETAAAAPEWPAARRRVAVHTLRHGAPWWMSLCAPTLDAWCARHGHPLRVWGPDDIDPAYPAAKFCEIDMLREFLAGEAEWLLYVDADVYVDADAPPHPDFEGKTGFLIREDLPGGGPRDFARWCRRHQAAAPGWTYRNAGVWACDRDGARRMLDVIAPPYREGCQEQHQWNHWLSLAAAAGMEVGFLPAAWNAWAWEGGSEPGAFYHIAGKKKVRRLGMFRASGRIPHDPPVPAPAPSGFAKAFDDSPYLFTRHDKGWDADDRHIHLLFAATGLETGIPGKDRVAVEVGSFCGRSTSAFVEALRQGKLGHLHVVETKPTASLRQVIAMAPADTVTLHTRPYWELEIGPADIVFIDGDHKWPAVGDTMRALTWGAKILCLHDTQAWPKYRSVWGSHLAGRMLKDMPGRQWIEDAVDRRGERTFRGLLVSAEQGIDLSSLAALARASLDAGELVGDLVGVSALENVGMEGEGNRIHPPLGRQGDPFRVGIV